MATTSGCRTALDSTQQTSKSFDNPETEKWEKISYNRVSTRHVVNRFRDKDRRTRNQQMLQQQELKLGDAQISGHMPKL